MLDPLYNTEEVYLLEKKIAQNNQITMALLMQRAGHALFQCIPKDANNVIIFIGPGNNGGDGIVAASFLKQFNTTVEVIHLTPLTKLSSLSMLMLKHAKALGVSFKAFTPTLLNQLNLSENDVIIDAIFGIGLSKAPQGNFKKAIDWINQSNAYVISADCPSGLCANTGAPIKMAISANMTCQFLFKKQGLYSEIASLYTGDLFFDDLAIDKIDIYSVNHSVNLLTNSYIENSRKKRLSSSHKGMLGHVLIIGGDTGMGGAGILNAFAALKSGAGKVTLLTKPEHVSASLSFVPEVMVKGINENDDICEYLNCADVIAIGSGMSSNLTWSQHFFELVLNTQLTKPKVFDAGILHYLAKAPPIKSKLKNTVITPHVGEAAMLLNSDSKSIVTNRFSAVNQLVKTYHATSILKGKGTLIQSPKQLASLCPCGNPYMATAGMGDMLTGIVASYLAQKYPIQLASELAVWDHANKADELFKLGKTPMLASEIFNRF
ncbi:NAD(P)H-hydrate dehydratase [Thiotrichales bacterium 19S3-7]|nr:NAD(P)H-hydrate dehydratase [Thiotrichales bacterium 19S3-7]MCF6802819.1 NAD(P)H-hydrate dehydratase [Thiotrichales bacterium 19S3-11]